jgi:hypothetical protein
LILRIAAIADNTRRMAQTAAGDSQRKKFSAGCY